MEDIERSEHFWFYIKLIHSSLTDKTDYENYRGYGFGMETRQDTGSMACSGKKFTSLFSNITKPTR
jgi:hypothetical protein